jgi:hypothetical protein
MSLTAAVQDVGQGGTGGAAVAGDTLVSSRRAGSYTVTLSVAPVSSSKVISGAGRQKPLVRTAR